MEWKTIISFTDNNRPYRCRVSTMRSIADEKTADDVYKVRVKELDEFDNPVDDFEFNYNSKKNDFETTALNKPVLLISEQMLEAVRKGEERW